MMESFFKSAYGSNNVKVAIGANGLPVVVALNQPVDTAVSEKRDDHTARVENGGKRNEDDELPKLGEENEDKMPSKVGEYDEADKSLVMEGESHFKTLTTELSLLKKRFEEERDDESLTTSLVESMKKDFEERIRNIEAQFDSMVLEQSVKPKQRSRLSFLRRTRSGKPNNSPTPSVELKASSSSNESASET